VTNSLLHKWFGDPRGALPDVERARGEFDRLAAARPELLPVLGWLREMLPELASPSSAPVVLLDPERARAKLKEGIPLLRDERVAVDADEFRSRWQRACEALETQQADGVAAALGDAVRAGRLDPGGMVDAVLAGKPEAVRGRAQELGLDAGLATILLRFTLGPLFTALEASLGTLRAGVDWERGYCPTCGCWPLLGEFRGLDQLRFLRCGLCASDWEVPRLWCPFCGNRDHEQLGFLHSAGEETQYRASLCDSCRGYVKMISTLSRMQPLHLLVADAATLHLDLAAAERGYTSHS
jgi:FdhE protein